MKKFTAVLIVLVLCTGLLAGCGTADGKEAYDLYQKMNKAMADASSLDMDISSIVDMTIDGEEVNTTTKGNMKQVMHSASDFDIEINLTTTTMGMDVPMIAYYTGGVYYFDTNGMKMKMPMSVDEAMQQAGGIKTLDFYEDAIKDFKITDADGGKKIEFTLDGKAIQSLTEKALASMQNTMPGITAADLNMNIGDVTCEAVTDKDGMMKSYRMIYDMTMTVEGQSLSMKTDTTMTMNSYNDVVINVPDDLDEYVEIDLGV